MPDSPEPIAGFEEPLIAQDNWVARLYEEHGAGETPSLADLEPIVTPMLESPVRWLDALEMVLGRRVDAKELQSDTHLGRVMATFAFDTFGKLTPEERFGVLLVAVEQERLQQAKKDE